MLRNTGRHLLWTKLWAVAFGVNGAPITASQLSGRFKHLRQMSQMTEWKWRSPNQWQSGRRCWIQTCFFYFEISVNSVNSPGARHTNGVSIEIQCRRKHICLCHDDVINWKPFSRITGPLCGEFTGPRWIPLTKASDAELGCFLWSVPGQTIE